jgi:hypothetical protein
MKEDWPGDLCEVADDTSQPKRQIPVTHELIYVEHEPDFTPKTGGAQTVEAAYEELLTALTEMMNALPDRAKAQYEHTFMALARMRDAYRQHGSSRTG